MRELLKNKKLRLVIWNSVLLVIGLLFCFLPETSISILESIVATCLILYGIFCLFAYLFTPAIIRQSDFLISSIIFIFAGIFLNIVNSLFVIGMGIFLLIQGLIEIVYAKDLRLMGEKTFWIDAILGLVMLILGTVVVIICNTSVATTIVSLILGISLIIFAGGNLCLIFALHRTFDKFKTQAETQAEKQTETDANNFTDYDIK